MFAPRLVTASSSSSVVSWFAYGTNAGIDTSSVTTSTYIWNSVHVYIYM